MIATPPAAAEAVTAPPEEPAAGREPALPFYEAAEDFALSDIADRLRRRAGYRLLLHQAWIQPGFDRASAAPVDLDLLARGAVVGERAALADEETQLSASATFYRSRYLHLALNAELADRPDSRIRERRRMRIGELHYFDAPRLGAIATVSRFAASDATEASP
jgi:hypothetical protein